MIYRQKVIVWLSKIIKLVLIKIPKNDIVVNVKLFGVKSLDKELMNMIDKLVEIEKSFNVTAEVEGEVYKWMGLRKDDIEYLISEIKRYRTMDMYSTKGAALLVNGKLKLGIQNNLENNFKAMEDGTMKINWTSLL